MEAEASPSGSRKHLWLAIINLIFNPRTVNSFGQALHSTVNSFGQVLQSASVRNTVYFGLAFSSANGYVTPTVILLVLSFLIKWSTHCRWPEMAMLRGALHPSLCLLRSRVVPICIKSRGIPSNLIKSYQSDVRKRPAIIAPGFHHKPSLLQTSCVLRSLQNSFHTSHRRDVHPILWIIVKPAAKLFSLLTGR